MVLVLHRQIERGDDFNDVAEGACIAQRRSTRRRADTGNDGDGREQGARPKRRALTGFRPAPPVVGNCRPHLPRPASCVLRPSPSPPAVLTAVTPSLPVSLNIPDG